MTKERRTFSSEFKLQMVRLYKNGKLKNEIIRKDDLKPSIISIDKTTPKYCTLQSSR